VTDLEQTPLVEVLPEGSLGIHGSATQVSLQMDVFKELVNKLRWAIGSVYRRPYSNRRSHVSELSIEVARRLISVDGWPDKIKK